MGPDDRDGAVEACGARLLTAGAPGDRDDAEWAAFDARPAAFREAVVDTLKARVDTLVRNEPPAALEVAEVLVRAARGLDDREPLALRGRATAAHFNGREDVARADFERAAVLYERLGRPVDLARVLRSLVDVHQMAGRSAEALACGARAREILEQHDEPRLLAQVRLNVGNVHTRLDDYPAAEHEYAAARALFASLGDDVGLAFADFNLAVVAMNANRCADAERSWLAARDGMERAGMGMLVADCDYNLAYLESRRGRFERAIEGLDRARGEYERNGKPSGPALCDLDLAEIHLRLGTLRDAVHHAEAAAEVFERLGMEYELGRVEVLAATARARLGDAAGAADDLGRAEARFDGLGNASFAAFVGLQRAQLELERGHAAAQIDALEHTRRAMLAHGTVWLADLAALTHARALVAAGRPDEALAAVAALRDERPSESELEPVLGAIASKLEADALAARGDRERALEALRRAVSQIEDAWAQVPIGDVRIAFFRDQHPAFVDLAFLLLDAGQVGEALVAFERGRSRSLLGDGRVERDAEWLAEREHLDWLLARQLDEELLPLNGDNELRRDRAGVHAWRAEIDASRARLARLARVRSGAGEARLPTGVEDLAHARRGDELVLVYMTGPRGVSVVLVDADAEGRATLEARRLDLDERELASLCDRLEFQLGRRAAGADSRRLVALLDEFGARLLGPCVDRLAPGGTARPLVFVPYGRLHDVPFHAWRLDGEPIGARHDVTQAVSTWHLARQRRHARPPAANEVHAVGVTLGVLPAIERELEHLESVYGAQLTRSSPEELVRALHEGELRGMLLHVAGHARFEAERPRFSAVCLGDRFLLAHDIATMKLDVDLVTLSGCETGRKRTTGGDELLGLSRALIGAGARAVVGTLWPVHDADAAAFMSDLYAELGAGRAVSRAIGAARRAALIRDDDPFTWAAFSLLGDPEVCVPARSPNPHLEKPVR